MSLLFSWLLNAAYGVAIVLASPWIVWSAVRHGKYREGFAEKFLGHVPLRAGNRPCVWLHAVSVGEVNLLAKVIAELVERRPDCEIVVSTTTKTGFDLAQRKYSAHTVFYCPLDFTWATAAACRRVRPDVLVLAELELWPNLIRAAKRQGSRVAVINGRLSDNSFRGYGRLRIIVSRILRQIDLIAAQNSETANRFQQLGATPNNVQITGSVKFDGVESDRNNPKTAQLREQFGYSADDIVFLAGSTQAPEEAYALDIYQRLSLEYPTLRLVLVPRHPERFDEVAKLLEDSGVAYARRSVNSPSSFRLPAPAILVDTVGELGAWWGLATIGLVGGSFGSRGGQNMLEPAAYGVATCFGPKTKNFRDIVTQLLAADGAEVVQNADELEQFVRRVLQEPEWAQALGQRAQQLVISQRGAVTKTVDLLLPLIGDGGTAAKEAA